MGELTPHSTSAVFRMGLTEIASLEKLPRNEPANGRGDELAFCMGLLHGEIPASIAILQA